MDLIDNTKSYDTLKYDGVDRLLIAKGNNRSDSLHFSYSGNGNRLTKKKNASVTNYNYSNNRLTSTTGAEAVTYGYNSNGSITSDGTPTYAYDKLNRIVKITGISPTDTFAYDGENRRIYSSDSGLTFVNIYDIYGNMLSQYIPGSANYKTDYIWANGEPRMRIDTLPLGLGPLAPPSNPETQYWYHTDHLGTPYVSTDSFKTVRWKISLDPFGERVSEQNPSTNNLRFPGQYFDRCSGLDYNWHRYYQQKVGRYYQADPLLEQGLMNRWSNPETWLRKRDNLYSYVENNPVKWIDPFGLLPNYWWNQANIIFSHNFFGGAYDFFKNYQSMRIANTIGADKYFHCMANCRASKRGFGGIQAAEFISEARELFDEYIKGDPRSACEADRAANRQGRIGNPNLSCRQICGSLRPKGLDLRY